MQKLTIILLFMCCVLNIEAQKKIVSKKSMKTTKANSSLYPKGIVGISVQYSDYRLNHDPIISCVPIEPQEYFPDLDLIVFICPDKKVCNDTHPCKIELDSVIIHFKEDALSGVFCKSRPMYLNICASFRYQTPFKTNLKLDKKKTILKIFYKLNGFSFTFISNKIYYYQRPKIDTYNPCE